MMKVINYTALKKNRGQYLQAKSRRKSLKPPVPEASNSRDIRFFFSCRPFRKREKSSSKIKFRGWPHFSVFRVDFIKNRENREILSTRNLIQVRYACVYTRMIFLMILLHVKASERKTCVFLSFARAHVLQLHLHFQ